jgi:hypothetical protein
MEGHLKISGCLVKPGIELGRVREVSEEGQGLHRTAELKALCLYGGQPLWSSGQVFWLHIQRSVLNSRPYHIF